MRRQKDRGSKPCKECGNIFNVPVSQQKTVNFCSLKCKTENHKKIIMRSAKCKYCGITFEYESRFGDHGRKYCSEKCLNKRPDFKRQTFTCLQCGNEFTPTYRTYKRKYCSQKCNAASRKKPNNIYKDNGALNKKMHKAGLIKKCDDCGFKKYPEILGVHHRDGNHKSSSKDNILVLCPNCHSIRHLKHIVHQKVSQLK
jgi:hypothetical protein